MSTGDFHVKIMSRKLGLKKGLPIEIPTSGKISSAYIISPTKYISYKKYLFNYNIVIILIYYTTIIVIRQYFENIKNLNNCLLHY